MKKIRALPLALLLFLLFSGCGPKVSPALKLRADSVSSIEIKKTVYSDTDPEARSYVSKTVTVKEDIGAIVSWLQSLPLTKHEAIEIPIKDVRYVVVLNAGVEHKIIFLDQFVVYDGTAFACDETVSDGVATKYNLLNYPESETQLDLVK